MLNSRVHGQDQIEQLISIFRKSIRNQLMKAKTNPFQIILSHLFCYISLLIHRNLLGLIEFSQHLFNHLHKQIGIVSIKGYLCSIKVLFIESKLFK